MVRHGQRQLGHTNTSLIKLVPTWSSTSMVKLHQHHRQHGQMILPSCTSSTTPSHCCTFTNSIPSHLFTPGFHLAWLSLDLASLGHLTDSRTWLPLGFGFHLGLASTWTWLPLGLGFRLDLASTWTWLPLGHLASTRDLRTLLYLGNWTSWGITPDHC